MNQNQRACATNLVTLSLLSLSVIIPLQGAGAAQLQSQAKASCSAPDHLATIDSSFGADTPDLARQIGLQGTSVVRVALARTGEIKKTAIAQSSGYAVLDAAALRAVDLSTFKPETVACQGVDGQYLIEVRFDS